MYYNFGHLTKYTLTVCIHHLCHLYLSFLNKTTSACVLRRRPLLSVYAVVVHVCFSGGSYPVWPLAVIPGFWRRCGWLSEDGTQETETNTSLLLRSDSGRLFDAVEADSRRGCRNRHGPSHACPDGVLVLPAMPALTHS